MSTMNTFALAVTGSPVSTTVRPSALSEGTPSTRSIPSQPIDPFGPGALVAIFGYGPWQAGIASVPSAGQPGASGSPPPTLLRVGASGPSAIRRQSGSS